MTRYLLAFLATLALVLGACGDDDDNGSDGDATTIVSVSPSPRDASPEASREPAESPDDGDATPGESTSTSRVAPPPEEPPLEAGVQKIGSGTMTFVLAPNGSFPVDGYGLILAGTEPPPCADFVFAFSWEITDPDPPGRQTVAWEIMQQDAREEVASGASGTATVGCGQLTAINRDDATLTVSVHYVQGRVSG